MSAVIEPQELLRLFRSGSYRRMLEVFKADGRNYEVADIYLLGLAYFKLKQYQNSYKCFQFVYEHSDFDEPIAQHSRFMQAHVHLNRSEWNGAINFLEELAVDDYRFRIMATNCLAYGYWKKEDAEQAISHWERILQVESNNLSALNSLGYALCDTETDLNRGLSYCRRVVDIRENYSPYLDSLGWALFKNGHRAKAIYMLRKAMILSPENTEIRGHLDFVAEEDDKGAKPRAKLRNSGPIL